MSSSAAAYPEGWAAVGKRLERIGGACPRREGNWNWGLGLSRAGTSSRPLRTEHNGPARALQLKRMCQALSRKVLGLFISSAFLCVISGRLLHQLVRHEHAWCDVASGD
jgi:hypothetical protein